MEELTICESGVYRPLTPEELAELMQRRAGAAEAAVEAVRLARAEYLAEVREMREDLLNRLTGIAMAAQLQGDTTLPAAFVQARKRLLDITKVASVVNSTTAAECKAAVKAEYANIAVQAPTGLRTAFSTMGA